MNRWFSDLLNIAGQESARIAVALFDFLMIRLSVGVWTVHAVSLAVWIAARMNVYIKPGQLSRSGTSTPILAHRNVLEPEKDWNVETIRHLCDQPRKPPF